MTDGTKSRNRRRLAAIAVLTVLVIAGYAWLNGGSIDPTDKEYYVVVSSSMDGEDTGYDIGSIPVWSLIVVEDLDDADIASSRPGDVLAYRSGSAVVAHRVVSVDAEDRTVTVRGDMNETSETVPFDIVAGKVVAVHPWIGKLVVLLTNRTAYLVAELLCAIVMVSCVREIREVLREERAEDAV